MCVCDGTKNLFFFLFFFCKLTNIYKNKNSGRERLYRQNNRTYKNAPKYYLKNVVSEWFRVYRVIVSALSFLILNRDC